MADSSDTSDLAQWAALAGQLGLNTQTPQVNDPTMIQAPQFSFTPPSGTQFQWPTDPAINPPNGPNIFSLLAALGTAPATTNINNSDTNTNTALGGAGGAGGAGGSSNNTNTNINGQLPQGLAQLLNTNPSGGLNLTSLIPLLALLNNGGNNNTSIPTPSNPIAGNPNPLPGTTTIPPTNPAGGDVPPGTTTIPSTNPVAPNNPTNPTGNSPNPLPVPVPGGGSSLPVAGGNATSIPGALANIPGIASGIGSLLTGGGGAGIGTAADYAAEGSGLSGLLGGADAASSGLSSLLGPVGLAMAGSGLLGSLIGGTAGDVLSGIGNPISGLINAFTGIPSTAKPSSLGGALQAPSNPVDEQLLGKFISQGAANGQTLSQSGPGAFESQANQLGDMLQSLSGVAIPGVANNKLSLNTGFNNPVSLSGIDNLQQSQARFGLPSGMQPLNSQQLQAAYPIISQMMSSLTPQINTGKITNQQAMQQVIQALQAKGIISGGAPATSGGVAQAPGSGTVATSNPAPPGASTSAGGRPLGTPNMNPLPAASNPGQIAQQVLKSAGITVSPTGQFLTSGGQSIFG